MKNFHKRTPPPPNGGPPRTERSPLPFGHLPTPWGVTPFRGGLYSSSFCCPPVSAKGNPVENIPPECFQNHSTASGTQGGAVLFAPPSKSCRFSHPPSPCARSMAQGISLSADSDSGGSSPPENLSPAVLSWSSLMRSNGSDAFCFLRMRYHAPPIKTVLRRP